jgi:hypothetical protein
MLSCIVLSAAALAITLLLGSGTFAQTPPAPTHKSVTIVIGNKFQGVLNASTIALRMLRISNNNTNDDSCWVFVGSSRASKEASYEVPLGKEYLRYPPFVPSDAIQATCAYQTLSMSNTNKKIAALGTAPPRTFCGKFLVLLNARLAPPTTAEEYCPRALGEG